MPGTAVALAVLISSTKSSIVPRSKVTLSIVKTDESQYLAWLQFFDIRPCMSSFHCLHQYSCRHHTKYLVSLTKYKRQSFTSRDRFWEPASPHAVASHILHAVHVFHSKHEHWATNLTKSCLTACLLIALLTLEVATSRTTAITHAWTWLVTTAALFRARRPLGPLWCGTSIRVTCNSLIRRVVSTATKSGIARTGTLLQTATTGLWTWAICSPFGPGC